VLDYFFKYQPIKVKPVKAMVGYRRVDFMFWIRFLTFFDHPVACYDCLKTLYTIVKLVPNFLNYAAFRSVFTDRNAAITERNVPSA